MLHSSGNRARCLLSLVSCLALANAPLSARAQDEAIEIPGLPTLDDVEFFDESRQPGLQWAPQAAPEHEPRTVSPFLDQVLKSWPLSVWTTEAAEHQCPLCGHTHEQHESPALFSTTLKPKGRKSGRLLDRSTNEAGKHAKHGRNRLRPGETANILVEVRERLGSNALSGTSFDDKPSNADSDDGESEASRSFVEWIQALDDEHRREALLGPVDPPAGSAPASTNCPACPSDVSEAASCCPAASSLCAPSSPQPSDEAVALDADQAAFRIEVLRKASRELSRAAELLEEGDLFDQADEIHRVAGELRDQARAVVLARRQEDPTRRSSRGGLTAGDTATR